MEGGHLHLRDNGWGLGIAGELLVLSIDFDKMLSCMPAQCDIIDELLADVAPLPLVEEAPPVRPQWLAAPVASPVASAVCSDPSTPVYSKYTQQRKLHGTTTDAIIIDFVREHGPKWRALARHMGGRSCGYTDDVVRNRYIRVMHSRGTPYDALHKECRSIRRPEQSVERWTQADDALIAQGLCQWGTKWSKIAALFHKARTPQAVRNRANRIDLVMSKNQRAA